MHNLFRIYMSRMSVVVCSIKHGKALKETAVFREFEFQAATSEAEKWSQCGRTKNCSSLNGHTKIAPKTNQASCVPGLVPRFNYIKAKVMPNYENGKWLLRKIIGLGAWLIGLTVKRDICWCLWLMRSTVSVNWQTAAGAVELWRRQSWAEPGASGGINTQRRRVYLVCFLRL